MSCLDTLGAREEIPNAHNYAAVKGAAEGLGFQSLAADLGWPLKVRLWIDSSAAKAVASRIGLGKIRHVEVRYLWIQEDVARGRIELKKVLGTENPADVLTKPKAIAEFRRSLGKFGAEIVGRSELRVR